MTVVANPLNFLELDALKIATEYPTIDVNDYLEWRAKGYTHSGAIWKVAHINNTSGNGYFHKYVPRARTIPSPAPYDTAIGPRWHDGLQLVQGGDLCSL